MKTGVVAIPAAFGRGTAVMKVLPKGSKFMKPADFVPQTVSDEDVRWKSKTPSTGFEMFR